MNSCSITEQSIAEGVRIILEQKNIEPLFLRLLYPFYRRLAELSG